MDVFVRFQWFLSPNGRGGGGSADQGRSWSAHAGRRRRRWHRKAARERSRRRRVRRRRSRARRSGSLQRSTAVTGRVHVALAVFRTDTGLQSSNRVLEIKFEPYGAETKMDSLVSRRVVFTKKKQTVPCILLETTRHSHSFIKRWFYWAHLWEATGCSGRAHQRWRRWSDSVVRLGRE